MLGEGFGGRLLAQQPVLQTEAVTAWEAKADLHYKRWLSCFCQALRLPSTGTYSPENPELEAEDRLSLPMAAHSDCAEHGPCGTPAVQRSRIGFVPSSTAVSHPGVGG